MASTAAEAAEQPAQEQQANGNGEQKTRHSEVGHKSLLKSDDLYQVLARLPPPPPFPSSLLALWILFLLLLLLVCWV